MGIIKTNVQFGGGYINGIKVDGMAINRKIIYRSKPKFEIVDFATGTDEQIAIMLEAHYRGDINIGDYWHVGDTRVMHLSAMPATPPYAEESHAEQDMTMVIIGIEHDDLKEAINGKTKAAITLQCRELLGNNGNAEVGYIWGSNTSTSDDSNYSKNPRRTWLNGTFVNSLPTTIQSLIKTVVKKNLANHTNNTAGPNTEDKAFLTSYPEMFGSARYDYYKGSPALEGEQYAYYNSAERRKKYPNNNGVAKISTSYYWLRSPGNYSYYWMIVDNNGFAYYLMSNIDRMSFAPAFCL